MDDAGDLPRCDRCRDVLEMSRMTFPGWNHILSLCNDCSYEIEKLCKGRGGTNYYYWKRAGSIDPETDRPASPRLRYI